MKALTIKEILDVTGGKLINGDLNQKIKDFSLDSRTIKRGDIFIAIPGSRFDGHQFLKEVVRKLASGIIIKEGYALPLALPKVVIRVKDTIEALGSIAGLYRKQFHGPLISITGSVGKTSTKEIVSAVLGQKFSVHKTEGTLNNHIGVPLTLMGLNSNSQVAVVELGMNKSGEIGYLANITRSDVGIITNIGPVHLEYLGDVEGIINAKSELLDLLGKDKLAVLNRDDVYFSKLSKNVKSRLITVGRHSHSDFQALDLVVCEDGCLNFKIMAKPFSEILEVKLPIIGLHNIYPALIAAAVGYGLGLKANEIINGLGNIVLPKMRLELKEIAGIKVIDDCYNANPISMAGALDTLAEMKTSGKKIFICGDMLELGKDSVMFHEELGLKVSKCEINKLITVGNYSKSVSSKAIESGMSVEDVNECKNNIDVIEVLAHWLEPGDIVLVKGSRANHMEEIIKGIEECYNVLEQLII